MKTLLSALKRYWRELVIICVVFAVCFALPFFEVRNPILVSIVVVIVAAYFMATWACKPRFGDNNENE